MYFHTGLITFKRKIDNIDKIEKNERFTSKMSYIFNVTLTHFVFTLFSNQIFLIHTPFEALLANKPEPLLHVLGVPTLLFHQQEGRRSHGARQFVWCKIGGSSKLEAEVAVREAAHYVLIR